MTGQFLLGLSSWSQRGCSPLCTWLGLRVHFQGVHWLAAYAQGGLGSLAIWQLASSSAWSARNQIRSCNAFYDFASGVIYCHFCPVSWLHRASVDSFWDSTTKGNEYQKYGSLGSILGAGCPMNVHSFLWDEVWSSLVTSTDISNREYEILKNNILWLEKIEELQSNLSILESYLDLVLGIR